MATFPVRAVILDYGGVVYAEGVDDFDRFGVPRGLAPGRLWAAYHDVPEYGPSRRGEIGADAYLAGVVRFLGDDVGPERAAALVREFQDLRRAAPAVVAEMRPVLAKLRERVRLGLLSNAGRKARESLEARGVAVLFDDVVCSAEVGLAKPDPAVFRLAASRVGVEPHECAFVDDMERHVAAARTLGMAAHHHHASRHAELIGFLRDVGALARDDAS